MTVIILCLWKLWFKGDDFILDSRDIVQSIRSIASSVQSNSKPVDFFFGTVVSEKPLKILVEQKLLLSEKQLILMRNTSDYETEISFDNPEIMQEIEIKGLNSLGEIDLNGSPQKLNILQDNAQIKCFISNKAKTKHKITVYNGLKNGEKVILARFFGGEKFLILDRTV